MLAFGPNSDVTMEFDLIHPQTNEILTPVSASYSVFDDEGTEIVASTAITIVGGEQALFVTVDAADNLIATGTNAARTILVTVVTSEGAVQLTETYVLETFGFLAIPAESGMTVPQSLMLSRRLAQGIVEVWKDVEDQERQAALREAWSRISKMSFEPWYSYETSPEGISTDLHERKFRINSLSDTDWALLPTHFKNALKNAQLIEACVLLEGDPTWDRRQDGLISKTVGESSEMFSTKKSVTSSISPKAYRELRGYIRRTITLGRA